MTARIGSRLSILGLGVALSLLGGCSEYLMREDRIALSAGNAVEANKVTHINDPWPREGFDTRPSTVGQRVVVPLQRYRSGLPPARGNQGGAPAGVSGGATAQISSGATTN